MAIAMTLNGKAVRVEVPGNMPLLWVLRDELDLCGTKFGCGAGQCGACTVHQDGVAIRSCLTPVSAVAGKKITTIEGLSPEGTHALQKAWIETDVPQCGYCQAGQLMTAAALLAKNANPTDAEIENALDGNLCRCGTYIRIKKAVRLAVNMMNGTQASGGNNNE
jgi:isoquinoline 1-oxidoreductase subunit alpha